MNWCQHVDLYCERLAPGWLNEPVNLFTNVIFFVGAWVCWRMSQKVFLQRQTPLDIKILIVLLACVGAGSALFHSLANQWSHWLDVLFIALFVFFCFGVFAIRTIGLRIKGVLILFGLLMLTTWLFAWGLYSPLLNDSNGYFGVLLALMGVTIYSYAKGFPGCHWFSLATVCFILALFFRTIDLYICGVFPLGTHFLWHIGVGLTGTFAVLAVMKETSPL